MIKKITNIALKSTLLSAALMGNIDVQEPEFIDDDLDYIQSNLVDILGSFNFNKAAAKDILINKADGTDIDSGEYTGELYNALFVYTQCDYGCNYNTEDRDYDNPVRDRACDVVADSMPVDCVASEARQELIPDGCSDAGLLSQWGDFFKPSCNTHDLCYGDVDSTRSECNSLMKSDMYKQCSNPIPGFTVSQCKSVANTAHNGVVALGWLFYSDAQKAATCVYWSDERAYWGCPRA